MVRRCIHKPTCQEYAVKIIDVTGGGSFSSEEVQELREATLKEVDILQKVSGYPNISKCILQTPPGTSHGRMLHSECFCPNNPSQGVKSHLVTSSIHSRALCSVALPASPLLRLEMPPSLLRMGTANVGGVGRWESGI